MSTESVRLERRVGQRFEVNLPLAVHFDGQTFPGFTQDVSSRGLFFYTEADLPAGSVVELTFTMPSLITLAESMRVRCRGHILRASGISPDRRNGVAVRLDSYQYLAPSGQEPEVEIARVSPGNPCPENPRPWPR
jgi:hypothetical protein